MQGEEEVKWYYDIRNNMTVSQQEEGVEDQNNNGDYHHHDWVGPFDTFSEAKAAGLKELSLEVRMAQRRYREFDSVRKGHCHTGRKYGMNAPMSRSRQ